MQVTEVGIRCLALILIHGRLLSCFHLLLLALVPGENMHVISPKGLSCIYFHISAFRPPFFQCISLHFIVKVRFTLCFLTYIFTIIDNLIPHSVTLTTHLAYFAVLLLSCP